MSTRQFDVAVYLGRFQPLHNGHLAVLRKALEVADHVIVVLGSAHKAPDVKNPFNEIERKVMVRGALRDTTPEDYQRVSVVGVRDHLYSDALWITDVQQAVGSVLRMIGKDAGGRVTIVGHPKDRSSAYLDEFPQWQLTHVPLYENLHATDVRERYFTGADWAALVPPKVALQLAAFKGSDAYHRLAEEWHFLADYKSSWANTPYPVQFNCCDAVVHKSGHVLMVKRGGHPGNGQWALPGGFINQHESAFKASLRELKEETRILVPRSELVAAMRDQHVFDHPERSLRGRTFSHAFYYHLGNGELPEIHGDDDAAEARWWALADLIQHESMIYEDHLAIIEHFLVRT
jgi:bifunctional NMN adenylyltransferase/nudix hydrolase